MLSIHIGRIQSENYEAGERESDLASELRTGDSMGGREALGLEEGLEKRTSWGCSRTVACTES